MYLSSQWCNISTFTLSEMDICSHAGEPNESCITFPTIISDMVLTGKLWALR